MIISRLAVIALLCIVAIGLSGCSVRWGERHPMEEHVNRVKLVMPEGEGLRGGK